MGNLILDIILGTAEFILSGLGPLLVYTGEISLWLLTLGYRRPQFKFEDRSWKAYLLPFNRLTFWIGMIVWVVIPISVYIQFYK